jgi:hypothetical protein
VAPRNRRARAASRRAAALLQVGVAGGSAGGHGGAAVAAPIYVTAFVPDGDEPVNTLISGFPADGPQPPILPPRVAEIFRDAAAAV